MKAVRVLIPTGYGLNCDYETEHALHLSGAVPHRVHINDLITGRSEPRFTLDHYHLLVIGGGFSWADDHGAGVILASKLKFNLWDQIEAFIGDGKLIMGICNGFQGLINMGLLPSFNGNYGDRLLAITYNDSGNFTDTWVKLKINKNSPCVFTKGMSNIELPVRHGEGKFYAAEEEIDRLFESSQVVMQYADHQGEEAGGRWPLNPNGSLGDIAGICDPTGRIFGLMPHPEGYNHYTNHPDWARQKELLLREGQDIEKNEGEGIRIFKNAVQYIKNAMNDSQFQ